MLIGAATMSAPRSRATQSSREPVANNSSSRRSNWARLSSLPMMMPRSANPAFSIASWKPSAVIAWRHLLPPSCMTSGLPFRSLKLALIAGRSAEPVMRAWPVTGSRLRHIAVVRVQPISRICPPSSEQSTFWPMPVARA